MVQKIDLTGRVFRMLKENNLMIEESQRSSTNENGQYEEWMLSREAPDEWSDDNVNQADQPDERGYPILAPIERIADEEHPEGVFRFPHRWEMRTPQIEQLIKERGTDALAWYHPFHMDSQENWGITILDQGIWYLACKLAEKMYTKPYEDNQIQLCRNIAKNFLYHHEMFHFKVELAATMVEIINPYKPIYAHYWSPQQDREWFGSEVKSQAYVIAPLEEALANSYALDKICSQFEDVRKDVKKAIVSFIKTQPDGWKHAWRVSVGGENWKVAMNELINKLLNATDEDNLFSPHRTLLAPLFFNGGQGKEDWIEEYYEAIVPCRILDTGFARGLFSKSGRRETPRPLGAFCMTNRCAKEYEGAPRGIQLDLIAAVTQDWVASGNGFSLESRRRREYKPVSKGSKWQKPVRVREFRLFSDNNQDSWRVYEEKYRPTQERVLRKMHKKGSDGKQSIQIKKLKKPIDPYKIEHHNEECNHK